MSLIDDLTPVFTDLNEFLVEETGTRVSVYRLVQTKVSGSTGKSYEADATLADITAQVIDPVTAAKRQIFGLTSNAELVLLVPTQLGALPAIDQGDGIKFLSGPYTGRKFLALANGAPDAIGTDLALSLTEAPSSTVMA